MHGAVSAASAEPPVELQHVVGSVDYLNSSATAPLFGRPAVGQARRRVRPTKAHTSGHCVHTTSDDMHRKRRGRETDAPGWPNGTPARGDQFASSPTRCTQPQVARAALRARHPRISHVRYGSTHRSRQAPGDSRTTNRSRPLLSSQLPAPSAHPACRHSTIRHRQAIAPEGAGQRPTRRFACK